MNEQTQERLARRRAARARTMRRRRLAAGAAASLAVALIAWLAFGQGGGRSGRPGASGEGGAGRAHGAVVRVRVSETAPLPASLQDASAAPSGAGALLIGGLDGGEASLSDVLRLDGSGARRVGTLPAALHDACASAVAGNVYVFGGGQVESFSRILAVDGSGAAHAVGSLPTAASDVACTAVAGTVYVVGGYTGQEPLRTIVAWRPGATPQVVAQLPKPLRYAAIGQAGGEVLIAGGTSGAHTSSAIYRFDPARATVTALGHLPRALTHAAGASLGGAMLVIGGRGGAAGSQRREILAVSGSGAVTVAGSLPRALSDLAAAQVGASVIAAGGQDSEGHTRSEVLSLALAR